MRVLKVYLAAILSVVIIGQGCGGGTKGTGGDQLIGKVLTPQQAPIVGVTVTELNSGESAVTENDGSFFIETELRSGPVVIGLDIGQVSTTVSLGNVTNEAVTLEVRIELDANTGAATPVEVEVTERRPLRTPTPRTTGTVNTPPTTSPGVTPTTIPPAPAATLTPSPSPTEDHDDDGNDSEEVEDTGVVTSVNSSAITINGTTYAVTQRTEVRGGGTHSIADIDVGDTVRVKGERINGSLEAREIELRSEEEK